MEKTVERKIVENWLASNYPNAVSKLSVESGISTSLIQKMRYGQVPKRESLRLRLSIIMGVSEDQLFPMVNINSAS